MEIGGAKALDKKIIPILLHVEPNEVPSPISQLLARDINEFDTYVKELSAKTKTKTKERTSSKAPKAKGVFAVGEKVRVVEVDHLSDEDKGMSPKWTSPMNKFSGSTATIQSFNERGRAVLDIDEGKYKWRNEWLVKLG